MKNKRGFKVSSTGNENLMFENAKTANIVCAPPPPNKWRGFFMVRGNEVSLFSSTQDRDEALVQMTVSVYDMVKEPFGIRFKGIFRI